MEHVIISSKGQIVIPKKVRDALNLTEGSRMSLEVRGRDIILSKGGAWEKLQGAEKNDLMEAFAAFKKKEREIEDLRP